MKRLLEVPSDEGGSALVDVDETFAVRGIGKDRPLHEGAWDDPVAGVAQALVRQGIPPVTATLSEISEPAVVLFSQSFCPPAAGGFLVDMAMAEARRAISAAGKKAEWATPKPHMRAPDGRVVTPSQVSGAEQPTSEGQTRTTGEVGYSVTTHNAMLMRIRLLPTVPRRWWSSPAFADAGPGAPSHPASRTTCKFRGRARPPPGNLRLNGIAS